MSCNICRAAFNYILKHWISVGTVVQIVLGLVCGHLVRYFANDGRPLDKVTLKYITLPTLIFTRCLLLLVVPYLIASLSTSLLLEDEDDGQQEETTSTADKEQRKTPLNAQRLIVVSLAFFFLFTSVATFFGMSLILIFRPGKLNTINAAFASVAKASSTNLSEVALARKQITASVKQYDSIMELVLNLVPSNLVSTLVRSSKSRTTPAWPSNASLLLEPNYRVDMTWQETYSDTPNMLGLCLLSLVLGWMLQALGPEKGRWMRRMLHETNTVTTYLINALIKTMPVAMFLWMFAEAARMPAIDAVLGQLVLFFLLAIVGFAGVFLLFYPIVYYIFLRSNPFRFYLQILEPMGVAFASASSTITLPVTMHTMEVEMRLDRQLCRFVLPLGRTLNMNGTASYYAMCAIFIAQVKDIELTTVKVVVLAALIILITMSLPGMAGGAIMFVAILESVLAIDDAFDMLVYILAFDWILERIRTMLNVTGDCFVMICMQSMLSKWLQRPRDPAEGETMEVGN